MPFEYGNLVDSNLGHALERAVCQAIVDDYFDGPKNASPACFEDSRDLVPEEASRPSGQKDLVGVRHLLFPVHPGNPFALDSILGTVDPAREEAEDHPVVPQGKILDPLALRLVSYTALFRPHTGHSGRLPLRGRISTVRIGRPG